jgi:hypothetical protein
VTSEIDVITKTQVWRDKQFFGRNRLHPHKL